MTKVVHKYPITISDGPNVIFTSSNPHSKALLVDVQGIDSWYVWLEETDPNHKNYIRRFWTIGTGQDVPDEFVHIASFQDGPFVWHLYED